MREIESVRQQSGGNARRWFFDEYLELVVWVDPEGAIAAFELSYDVERDWRAVRWTRLEGTGHFRVDDGEDRPHRNAAPLLTRTKEAVPAELVTEFERRFQAVEPSTIGPVRAELRAFAVKEL